MSKTTIPTKTRNLLWLKSAGRCQYDSCNKPLWYDDITKNPFNSAYIAHIIADEPGGPRGDPILSGELADKLSNLMLLCDSHHRLIDKIDVDGHSVDKLQKMKQSHETRIEILTSICEDKQSHVLLYGANIGIHNPNINWQKASNAMVPLKYPAENEAIEISLINSSFQDHQKSFWEIERENLQNQFDLKVRRHLAMRKISHFSVFALGPQPLLIELGRLLSDIQAADIYQLHKEPADWVWQEHPEKFKFDLIKPETLCKNVALNLSLSGTINNSRITKVLGEDTSIWTITIENPENDFLKSREQLRLFRQHFRKTLDVIKAKHGQDTVLNIFPSVPAPIAVEIGRVWNPKADLPLSLYDQNHKKDGFFNAFNISGTGLGN